MSAMVKVYANSIHNGKRTINDVPEELKEEVKEYLSTAYGIVIED